LARAAVAVLIAGGVGLVVGGVGAARRLRDDARPSLPSPLPADAPS
jgi:hypothetical protein